MAKAQRTTGHTADGLPVHSFHSLIADLATLARNTVTTAIAPNHHFTIITGPTPIQHKALDLLAVTVEPGANPSERDLSFRINGL